MVGHHIIQNGTSTQIMNMSMSQTRGASTISTFLNPIKRKFGWKKRLSRRGTNALFRAISSENWELVCMIADTKPYKAEAWHLSKGFFDAHRDSQILPLHQACIFHPTADALTHIIQAFPTALRATESGYRRVPLHIACHSNASLECIQVLISHYPEASIETDVIGRVPLHYALSNGASYEIVVTLMDAAKHVIGPDSDGLRHVCSVADFNGWLPVHVACFMGVSSKVLALIVNAFPEGVDMATRKGSKPRGLLKGISISDDKKTELDTILRNKGTRTKIERVVNMSDETCSKGVTLEIDEDEASSLSTMLTNEDHKPSSYPTSMPLIPESQRPSTITQRNTSTSSQQLPTNLAYETESVAANSNDSTQDEDSVTAIFEPVKSTAAFC